VPGSANGSSEGIVKLALLWLNSLLGLLQVYVVPTISRSRGWKVELGFRLG
jgi:hypothetical protein